MAFLDNVGRKLSQAGQTTVQRTKDMAEIARFSSMISEEERIIEDTYEQIGRLYVEKHSEDYEEVFWPAIQSLRNSEENIREYREKIGMIKGRVKCARCGMNLPGNAAFCPSCGAEIVVVVPVASESGTEEETTEIQDVLVEAEMSEPSEALTEAKM